MKIVDELKSFLEVNLYYIITLMVILGIRKIHNIFKAHRKTIFMTDLGIYFLKYIEETWKIIKDCLIDSKIDIF